VLIVFPRECRHEAVGRAPGHRVVVASRRVASIEPSARSKVILAKSLDDTSLDMLETSALAALRK